MYNPAYIAIGAEGHVTLYWGDGTEEHKEIIRQGPRVSNNQEFIAVIEDLKAWAEEQGYTVIIPSYDFEPPEPVEIAIPEDEADQITYDDVDDLIDDLLTAENAAAEDEYDTDDDAGWYDDAGD